MAGPKNPVEERQPAEDVPLLAESRASGAERPAASPSSTPTSPTSSPSSSSSSSPKASSSPRANSAVCRICLEEDEIRNLEQPCSCSGTVSYAHHDCVQKWVATKGDKTCELCKQEYTGDFEVPPTPPPQPLEHVHFVGIRSVYLNPDGTVQREEEVLFDEEETLDERRRASIQWCLTFILFTTLMLLLHHSMGATDADGQPIVPQDDPSVDPDGFDQSTSLFWVLTRMLLIGLPLYMVMRAAQEARRAALQAHIQMMRGMPAGFGFMVPPPNSRWQELGPVHQAPHAQRHQAGPDNV